MSGAGTASVVSGERHETMQALFGYAYTALTVNVSLVVANLPLAIAVVAVPGLFRAWPFALLLSLTLTPSLAGAFGAFHALRDDAIARPIAAFWSSWRRHLVPSALLGITATAIVGAVLFDLALVSANPLAPLIAPTLVVIAAGSIAITVMSLAGFVTLADAAGGGRATTTSADATGGGHAPVTPADAGSGRAPVTPADAAGSGRVPTTSADATGGGRAPVTSADAVGSGRVPVTQADAVGAARAPASSARVDERDPSGRGIPAWAIVKASIYLAARRWYFSLMALALLALTGAAVLAQPVWGTFLAPSILLFGVWSNGHYAVTRLTQQLAP